MVLLSWNQALTNGCQDQFEDVATQQGFQYYLAYDAVAQPQAPLTSPPEPYVSFLRSAECQNRFILMFKPQP